MDGAPEGALVLEQVIEPVEVRAGALLDPRAPQVDDGLGGRRGGAPGEALAHHQRHGILDGRVGAVRDLGIIAAVVAVLQHGGEVDADAVHAARPDGLDAHLLDGLEDRAGRLGLRQEAAVGGGIVAGEFQRHGIGMAAHDGGLARAELAGRLGQARLGALAVADDAGLVGRVGDFEAGRAGHGAHAGGDRPLEGLLRGLGGRAGLAVRKEAHRLLVM